MIEVVFKNLEESQLARDIVRDRLQDSLERFPDLQSHRIRVTLDRYNSSSQPGPDLFGIKILITGRRYKRLMIEKRNANLYVAVADARDSLLELINRYGDRKRIVTRKSHRWRDLDAIA